MWIALDATNGLSLSRQLYDRIKKMILCGDLAAGFKLPSSRALSGELSVSRNTVLEAYDQLIAEGYLETRHGSGTVVAQGISAFARPEGYGNPKRTEKPERTGGPLPAREKLSARHMPDTERRLGRREAAPIVKEQPDIINFRSGIPALEAFPQKEWAKTYQSSCAALPASALRYCEPAGIRELREAIAAYLFRSRGIRCNPRRVMITSGSTQGLAIVSRLLHGNTQVNTDNPAAGTRLMACASGRGGRINATVLAEDPAHKGMLEVAVRAGYDVRGVRVDDDGMDTSCLEAPGLDKLGRKMLERDTLELGNSESPRSGLDADLGPPPSSAIAFVYTTPSHQYPMGGILPIQRRLALIDFAGKADCYVIEDDYDSEFRYEGRPVSSLYELDPERVIYLGSFSKILAPALRLGFAILPEALLEAWQPEKMYLDVHTDALSQYALAAFINNGELEKHIWKMKKLYKRKREHLIKTLVRYFKNSFEVKGQAAGLHVVAGFRGTRFSDALVRDLLEHGVKVIPVEKYSLSGNGEHSHEVILGYSHLSLEEVTRGVRILSERLAAWGKSGLV